MQGLLKRSAPPFYSFCLVFCAAVLCFSLADLGFWGGKSIAISDMVSQYSAFYELYRRGEFVFSWTAALGSNLVGTFAYYLSSPFNLLLLVFRNAPTESVVFAMLCLKLGCAGAAMTVYLRGRFPTLSGGFHVGLSLCHGLMSFVFFYFINLFWLDALIWLPLAALGLEKLPERKNSPLLLTSLTLLFLSNFYIAYICGLFLVLFALFRGISRALALKQLIGGLLRLAGHAVVAALLGAPLLLPMVFDFAGSFGVAYWSGYGQLNFTAKQLLLKLFCGSFDSIGNACAPTIFCSVAVFALALLWFLNRRLPRRAKAAGGALILLLLVSFFLPALDKIWHGFSYPNGFAYRYAFCFSFLLITLAAESLSLLAAENFPRQMLPAALGGAALAYCALSVPFLDDLGFVSVAVTIGAVVVFSFLFITLCTKPNQKKLLSILFVAVIAVELVFNGYYILRGVDAQNVFPDKAAGAALDADYDTLLAQLPGGDYRTEDLTDLNGGLRRGFKSLTLYSSSFPANLRAFYQQVGYASVFKSVQYTTGAPLMDDLLGLRFVFSDSPVGDYPVYASSGLRTVYENTDALPIGFLTDAGIVDFRFTGDTSDAPRALLEALCGETGSALSTDVLLNRLRESPLVPETMSGASLRGTIDAQQDGVLFLSVAYDRGWRVTVDGVPVQPVEIAGALTGIELRAGIHTVELRFTPYGMRAGVALCLLTAAGLAATAVVSRRKRKA